MKLINPSVQLLPQPLGEAGIYEQIEHVGKTCYKSVPLGGEGAVKFTNRMIANQHLAMLEHGTVYLKIPYNPIHEVIYGDPVRKYQRNPYSKVELERELSERGKFGLLCPTFLTWAYVTTNLRVIEENKWWDDMQYMCDPVDELHHKRWTAVFITDKGVSHELVRHRAFSFAQESSRYCNYSKSRFDGQVTFIVPTWYDKASKQAQKQFLKACEVSEKCYMSLLEKDLLPQHARQALITATKTEICMTGYEEDWKHFFDLRYRGITGTPHPDMYNLAEKLHEEFKKQGVEL